MRQDRLVYMLTRPRAGWYGFRIPPGVREAGREVDRSLLFSAEIKVEWNYSSAPSYVVESENVLFFYCVLAG